MCWYICWRKASLMIKLAGVESSPMSEERLSSKAILHMKKHKDCGLRICTSELRGEFWLFPSVRTPQKMYTALRRVIFVTNWGVVYIFFLYCFPRQLWWVTIFHYIKVRFLAFCYDMLNWKLDPRRVSNMSCVTRFQTLWHASRASHHASVVLQ